MAILKRARVFYLSLFVFAPVSLFFACKVYAGSPTIWGTDPASRKTAPVEVSGLSDVMAIAGGKYHSMALKNDGTVWTWGYNEYGQLGDGTKGNNRSAPAQVPGITGVTAISAGGYHTIALKSDSTVRTWGNNWYGQLGNGGTVDNTTPAEIPGIADIKAIAGGYYHTVAIKKDGTVLAWGSNYYGQLGDGTIFDKKTAK